LIAASSRLLVTAVKTYKEKSSRLKKYDSLMINRL